MVETAASPTSTLILHKLSADVSSKVTDVNLHSSSRYLDTKAIGEGTSSQKILFVMFPRVHQFAVGTSTSTFLVVMTENRTTEADTFVV